MDLQITQEFKRRVMTALLDVRKNFDGSDAAFAKQWGINGSVFNRMKKGETERVLRDGQWLNIGRELGVTTSERKWNVARTDVFTTIEEDILFCQQYSKSKICVDDCGIGKTFTAKYLSRTLKNVFYVDASQGKTQNQFVRLLAKAVGVDNTGRMYDIKENIKYYLRLLPSPVVIVDEAGDLDYASLLVLKEFWNATENVCGWYMMGADGLRAKIQRGIACKRVGYAELFSRYSERYTSVVPNGREDKVRFYRKLITDVLEVNMEDKKKLNDIVRRCLTNDGENTGGLRRAEALLILNS
jgi:hypothetical protein